MCVSHPLRVCREKNRDRKTDGRERERGLRRSGVGGLPVCVSTCYMNEFFCGDVMLFCGDVWLFYADAWLVGRHDRLIRLPTYWSAFRAGRV